MDWGGGPIIVLATMIKMYGSLGYIDENYGGLLSLLGDICIGCSILFPATIGFYFLSAYVRFNFDNKTLRAEFLTGSGRMLEKVSGSIYRNVSGNLLIYESAKYFEIAFEQKDFGRCLLLDFRKRSVTEEEMVEALKFLKYVFTKIKIKIDKIEVNTNERFLSSISDLLKILLGK